MWAGESCSVVTDLKPAADIVRELVHDAEAANTEQLGVTPLLSDSEQRREHQFLGQGSRVIRPSPPSGYWAWLISPPSVVSM
jgi:hypothetical protein